MQEQNFEKQVQKKLEELNLSPSGPVWKKSGRTDTEEKGPEKDFLLAAAFCRFRRGSLFLFNPE